MPGKKRIGSVHTAKNGRRYKITSKGARFIKGKAKSSKGGSVSVGGGMKRRRRTRRKKGGGFWSQLGSDMRSAGRDIGNYVKDTPNRVAKTVHYYTS